MTIIVVPTERCNFKCTGCFESQEVHDGLGVEYDFDAIKKNLNEIWSGRYYKSSVTLHGGECTMMPIKDFEKLLSLIYNLPWDEGKTKGTANIVTNGSLLTDKHLDLFKKYNTYVALSCDGPPELNIHRGPDPTDEEVTRQYNKQMVQLIKKIRERGIPLSVMCIIHNYNASTKEMRQKLGKWMLWLKSLGVKGGRVNPMFSDDHLELELSTDAIYQMWLNVYHWNKKHDMRWNPLIELEGNLVGKTRNPQPCVYNRCDPFNTHTISVLPSGDIGNCDRTFGHGLYTRSMSKTKSGRYEGLRQTDCKDCKYWVVCGGGCPETGIGGDWRRKTRFCNAIYKIYEHIEKDLRKQGVTDFVLDKTKQEIKQGYEDSTHGDEEHGDSDHGDDQHGDQTHGDEPHGDEPHADSDHDDTIDWRH